MARVRITAVGRSEVAYRIDRLVGQVTEEVYTDARRYCPIDPGTHLRSPGSLYRSLHTRRPRRFVGHVVVGTDHWHFVEYPTRPHIIRSRGPWPMRNPVTGDVFGDLVHHPGTEAQPFMRMALYQRRHL